MLVRIASGNAGATARRRAFAARPRVGMPLR